MRYILYARKSSEGADRQIQSLEDQHKLLNELASRCGLDVVDRVEEARSAKAPGRRPVFDEMLRRIEGGEADAILCWAIDRLTRNPVDAGTIAWMLQRGALKAIRTFDREYRAEDSALLLSLESGVANDYILRLSKNVSRGLTEKAARGWWPHTAPHGYRNAVRTRDGVPVSIILSDPKRFPLIRKAWEMAAAGSSVPRILASLESWGYTNRPSRGRAPRPISRSSLYRLLENPFYCGWIRYKGELIRGRHEPMITEGLYREARTRLEGGCSMRPQKHTFAFAGLLKCGVCGCGITAERKFKGRHTYVYYHCTGNRGCTKASVNEAKVEQAFADALARCRLDPRVADLVESFLTRWRTGGDTGAVPQTQSQALRDLNARLDALFEMRTGGEITPEEFVRRKTEVQNKIVKLERDVDEYRGRIAANVKAIGQAARFCVSASQRFAAETPEHKRAIAEAVSSEAVLESGTVRVTIHPLLATLASIEPPKGPLQRVGKPSFRPDSPKMRAVWDVVRTLVDSRSRILNRFQSHWTMASTKLPNHSPEFLNHLKDEPILPAEMV